PSLSSATCLISFHHTAPAELYTLSLHDALPICPVAQHGDEENLQKEPGSALVPAPERDAGGNGRARAVARDDETAGIGARGDSVPVGPPDGREAVVDGRGERVFGCEAVLHRHHHAVGAQGQAPAHAVVAVEAAPNESATVKIHHHGRAFHLEG